MLTPFYGRIRVLQCHGGQIQVFCRSEVGRPRCPAFYGSDRSVKMLVSDLFASRQPPLSAVRCPRCGLVSKGLRSGSRFTGPEQPQPLAIASAYPDRLPLGSRGRSRSRSTALPEPAATSRPMNCRSGHSAWPTAFQVTQHRIRVSLGWSPGRSSGTKALVRGVFASCLPHGMLSLSQCAGQDFFQEIFLVSAGSTQRQITAGQGRIRQRRAGACGRPVADRWSARGWQVVPGWRGGGKGAWRDGGCPHVGRSR